MIKNVIMGAYFPVTWILLFEYVPDVYHLHTALRIIAATLMVAYLIIVPMQVPFYSIKQHIRMSITSRIWVVVGIYALMLGHIFAPLSILIVVTSVICSTLMSNKMGRWL